MGIATKYIGKVRKGKKRRLNWKRAKKRGRGGKEKARQGGSETGKREKTGLDEGKGREGRALRLRVVGKRKVTIEER